MMMINKIKKIIPRTMAAMAPVPIPVFSVAAPVLAGNEKKTGNDVVDRK